MFLHARAVKLAVRKSVYGENITIFVTASNFSKIGFDFFYLVVKNEEEIVVAKARTGMVCYNYKLKKIAGVPEIVLRSFK